MLWQLRKHYFQFTTESFFNTVSPAIFGLCRRGAQRISIGPTRTHGAPQYSSASFFFLMYLIKMRSPVFLSVSQAAPGLGAKTDDSLLSWFRRTLQKLVPILQQPRTEVVPVRMAKMTKRRVFREYQECQLVPEPQKVLESPLPLYSTPVVTLVQLTSIFIQPMLLTVVQKASENSQGDGVENRLKDQHAEDLETHCVPHGNASSITDL
ncbi:hypothetical protein J6590_007280 [Homalodisca vitripennis]|nr:hypothetical protein J6590_007280 [Homalodisca vitripennis]